MGCHCKCWVRRWIFGLAIFGGLLKHPVAGLTLADIEQSLYDYAKMARCLNWKWLYPADVCHMYGPDGFDLYESDLEYMDIRLESVRCAKVEMEILSCLYERELSPQSDNALQRTLLKELHFSNGLNGEVYEMSMPLTNTRCSDPQSLVIRKCLNDGEAHAKDFTAVEELLLENRSRINSRKWRSTNFTCRLLCPRHYHFGKAKLQFVDVVLASLDRQRVRVKALKCYFKNSSSSVLKALQFDGMWSHYIRDVHGEVYELFQQGEETAPNVPDAFAIQRRVIDQNGRFVRPLCHDAQPLDSPLPPLHPKSRRSRSLSASASDRSLNADMEDIIVELNNY